MEPLLVDITPHAHLQASHTAFPQKRQFRIGRIMENGFSHLRGTDEGMWALSWVYYPAILNAQLTIMRSLETDPVSVVNAVQRF